ncbi:Lrp/AsnC family transcriptional regulator [Iamia sp. SCSIO 61187]|nr:Lrp/AsnC family transcriptional regulator [Iamia sp. SCSIO 61187]
MGSSVLLPSTVVHEGRRRPDGTTRERHQEYDPSRHDPGRRHVTGQPLDDIDRRIVTLLQDDGRMAVNELARRAGIGRATAYARLEGLRARGVITGFRAEVDPAAAGNGLAAYVFVDVEQQRWTQARAALVELPGLVHLSLTSGAHDAVLLVRCPDIDTLRDVVLVRLHEIPEVRSAQTLFVLDEERLPPLPPA